jgi:hypothetical protein
MIDLATAVLASFTQPEQIGMTPLSMLWILPLTASIAIVYKATKVNSVNTRAFVKETALLFGSIAVFMALAAVILCAIGWFFNTQWPRLLGYS